MPDDINDIILRQLVRETLMNEYQYKWGPSSSIEKGKVSSFRRSSSSDPLDKLSSARRAISNTAVARKVRSVLDSSSKVLTSPREWLSRTFRRENRGKLAKYGIVSLASVGVVTTLYDFFAHDGKNADEARSAERDCSQIIEDNKTTIKGTTFIGKLPAFTIDFSTLEPATAKSDLSKLISDADIPSRIRNLNDALEREDISNVSGVADTSLTLEEPNLNVDRDVQARALKVVVDAAVIDMSAALENELTNFFASLKENVESIDDPTKKSKMLEVFRQLDTELANALNLSLYPDLDDLLTSS